MSTAALPHSSIKCVQGFSAGPSTCSQLRDIGSLDNYGLGMKAELACGASATRVRAMEPEPPSMAIQPVTKNDMLEMVRIEFAAYAGDTLAKLLRGRDGQNPAHHARAMTRYANMLDEKSERQHFTKIVVGDTILGWMRWELLEGGRTCGFRQTPGPASWLNAAECAEPRELDMIKAYHELVEAQHLDFMADTPHMHLALLVIDPAHQRCGAGRMLFAEFVKRCDALALPAYLVASPEARRLYERHGFTMAKELRFSAQPWGLSDIRTQTIMTRLKYVPRFLRAGVPEQCVEHVSWNIDPDLNYSHDRAETRLRLEALVTD